MYLGKRLEAWRRSSNRPRSCQPGKACEGLGRVTFPERVLGCERLHESRCHGTSICRQNPNQEAAAAAALHFVHLTIPRRSSERDTGNILRDIPSHFDFGVHWAAAERDLPTRHEGRARVSTSTSSFRSARRFHKVRSPGPLPTHQGKPRKAQRTAHYRHPATVEYE